MAGAGYKLFNTGDVLTAAQVNTYLQEQTVMVFANATARTTALSGVLAEGMMSYLQDTNAVEVYNGSSWVAVGGGLTSPLTTKGDLWTYTTTNARLGVGTNGQVLSANSSASTGLEWVAAGGYSLIAEQTLSSSTGYSFSAIPGTYKHLVLTWTGLTIAAISSEFALRFNADSGANYNIQYLYFETGGSPSLSNTAYTTATPETFGIHTTNAGATTTARGSIIIYDYASTSRVKYYNAHHSHYSNNNARNNHFITQGYWSTSGSAITSLDITRVSGTSSISNQTATSVRLYGVN